MNTKKCQFFPDSILWILLCGTLITGCQTIPAPTIQTPTEAIASVTATPKAGDARKDAKGIEQVWVEAGSFRMGSSAEEIEALLELNPPSFVAAEFASEQPQHEVRISKGYWIDKYEVTNRAFRAFVDDGGYTNRAYWSAEGWEWLQGQPIDMLPMYCLGNAEENPVGVRDLVRSRGVCGLARRAAADRGGMGIRGPRTGITGISVGECVRSRIVQCCGFQISPPGWKLSGRGKLGRRARHGGERHGVGPGLAGAIWVRNQSQIRPVPRPGG